MSFLIDTIFYSEKRYSLLCLLYDKDELDIDDINNYLNESSVSILPQIKKLIENNIIENIDGKYKLTSIGRLISKKIKNYIKKIKLFEKNTDFWSNVDFSKMPSCFINNIGYLDPIYILDLNINSNNEESLLEKILKFTNDLILIINNNYDIYYNILEYRLKNNLYTKLFSTKNTIDNILKKINTLNVKTNINFEYYLIPPEINIFEVILTSDILILFIKKIKEDLNTISFILSCNPKILVVGMKIVYYYEKKSKKMSNDE